MKTQSVFCRLVVLATCLSLLLFGSVSSSNSRAYATTSAPPAKATWFWYTKLIETSSAELIAFMDSQQIDVVYLQLNRSVSISSYKNFIRSATAHNIEVHVLDGAPNWALESSLPKLEAFITWIQNYQNAASVEEQFSGIHIDIEPHLIPEWNISRDDLINQWQHNVTYLSHQSHEMNLPLSAALPFWMDNYKIPYTNMSISYWMISVLDSATIMTYRDTGNAIYDLGKKELEEAQQLNKKISLSVETKYSSEGNRVTFYEEGVTYMNNQLAIVNTKASIHTSYAGITIHDLNGWMNLVNNTVN